MFDRLVMSSGSTAVGNTLYVEDVFSTYLYTGNAGGYVTVNNGINLLDNGGMVWIKSRTTPTSGTPDSLKPWVFDTNRGENNALFTNTTESQVTRQSLSYFGPTGFNLSQWIGIDSNSYASWTFRKAAKFFDVVTYTGNGVNNRTISHSLGITPGCIMIKRTDSTSDWSVYHRSVTNNNQKLVLNSTAGVAAETDVWGFASGMITSSVFAVGSASTNTNGATYVAYLFAHDPSASGIIQCGSYTGTGATAPDINLGWEPQWILLKQAVVSGGSAGYTDAWHIIDNMRGMPVGSDDPVIYANSNAAENTNAFTMLAEPTATGWKVGSQANYSGATYVYVAIRRGPMKTPTSGTSVFAPVTYTGSGTATIQTLTTNFPVDAYIQTSIQGSTTNRNFGNRLIGKAKYLPTDLPAVEQTLGSGNGVNNDVGFGSNIGIGVTGDWNNPTSPSYSPYITWNFRRAPGFFDVVSYTGTNSNQIVNHNLGVVPEFVIIKCRSVAYDWVVGHKDLGFSANQGLNLNSSNGKGVDSPIQNPTSTQIQLLSSSTQQSGGTHVAYLFATCPGVSKVGSYTGNGTSQTINCGFSGGARFILIKRADSTGDWYVWDTARGITTSNDPHMSLNTTTAAVTTNDTIDTDSTGFVVNQVADTNVNVSSASYIYLAIA